MARCSISHDSPKLPRSRSRTPASPTATGSWAATSSRRTSLCPFLIQLPRRWYQLDDARRASRPPSKSGRGVMCRLSMQRLQPDFSRDLDMTSIASPRDALRGRLVGFAENLAELRGKCFRPKQSPGMTAREGNDLDTQL